MPLNLTKDRADTYVGSQKVRTEFIGEQPTKKIGIVTKLPFIKSFVRM